MYTGPNKGKCIKTGSLMPTIYPLCGMCGKNHGGKCKFTLELYFKCGQLDHLIKNYPKRDRRNGTVPNKDFKPKARLPVLALVYAVILGEVDAGAPRIVGANVISSIFL